MPVDDTYTKVLLHMNGADASTTFIDEAGKTWTASGNAQIDTAQYQFGGASLQLGSGGGAGSLSTGDSDDFDFGTGDFTIEAWLRRNGSQADYSPIIAASIYTGGEWYGWQIVFGHSGNANKIYFASGGPGSWTVHITSSVVLPDTTQTHFAVARYGNTLTMYFAGESVGSVDITGRAINSGDAGCMLGKARPDDSPNSPVMHIDEFRISKGIARWTANFTPPTREYRSSGGLFTFHG